MIKMIRKSKTKEIKQEIAVTESPTGDVGKFACGLLKGRKFGSAGQLSIICSLSLSKLKLGDKQKMLKKYKKLWNAKRRYIFWKLKKNDKIFGDVVLGKTLGAGGNGTVYLADLDGNQVAVKIINSNTIESEVPEIFISKITHPNLVKIMAVRENIDTSNVSGREQSCLSLSWDSFSSESFTEMAKSLPSRDGEKYSTKESWIMMEYCDKGTLWEYLQKGQLHENNDRRRPLFSKILSLLSQVANALAYLHKLGIVHGDIKTQNIFMKSTNTSTQNFIPKIGDFGHCRKMGKKGKARTFCWGTVDHMPPEILKDGVLSYFTDAFAFGMVMWETITSQLPYCGLPESSILISIVQGIRPKIPEYIPKDYSALMSECWHQDPTRRPTLDKVASRLENMREVADLWAMENEEIFRLSQNPKQNNLESHRIDFNE